MSQLMISGDVCLSATPYIMTEIVIDPHLLESPQAFITRHIIALMIEAWIHSARLGRSGLGVVRINIGMHPGHLGLPLHFGVKRE